MLLVLTKPKIVERFAQAGPAFNQIGLFAASTVYPRVGFDALSIEHRDRLLRQIAWLTTEWPRRFLDFLGVAKLTWSDLSPSELEMPYWLWVVCKGGFERAKYRISAQEAAAARALLTREGKSISKIALKRMLGVREAKVVDASGPPIRRSFSLEELLTITRQLDSDLRVAAIGRDVQASMLRDACCIATAIWKHISLKSTCTLSLSDGVALRDEWWKASTRESIPGTLAMLFAVWMDLYLSGTRQRFERYQRPQSALFLSRFGVPTNGFGLANRFAELLRRSGIQGGALGSRLLIAKTNETSRTY